MIINLQIYTKIKQNKSKGKEKKEQEYQIMQTVDSMRLIFSEVDWSWFIQLTGWTSLRHLAIDFFL